MKPIEQIAKEAFVRTTNALRQLPGLESMTLIGEPVDERAFEKVNDIDIVVITAENPTSRDYIHLDRRLRGNNQLSNTKTTVTHAIVDGPIKPAVKTEQEILFHILWHSAETYAATPTLSRYSWQYVQPFYGRHLGEYLWQPSLTAERVREAPSGLRTTLEAVRINTVKANVWKHEVPLTLDLKMHMERVMILAEDASEKLELYLYALLRGASNVLRYRHNKLYGVDAEMANAFAKEFEGHSFATTPLQAHDHKRQLRQRICPVKNLVPHYKMEAEQFLEYMIDITHKDEEN